MSSCWAFCTGAFSISGPSRWRARRRAYGTAMVVINLGLSPLWLHMMYGNALVITGARLIKNLVMFPLNTALLVRGAAGRCRRAAARCNAKKRPRFARLLSAGGAKSTSFATGRTARAHSAYAGAEGARSAPLPKAKGAFLCNTTFPPIPARRCAREARAARWPACRNTSARWPRCRSRCSPPGWTGATAPTRAAPCARSRRSRALRPTARWGPSRGPR